MTYYEGAFLELNLVVHFSLTCSGEGVSVREIRIGCSMKLSNDRVAVWSQYRIENIDTVTKDIWSFELWSSINDCAVNTDDNDWFFLGKAIMKFTRDVKFVHVHTCTYMYTASSKVWSSSVNSQIKRVKLIQLNTVHHYMSCDMTIPVASSYNLSCPYIFPMGAITKGCSRLEEIKDDTHVFVMALPYNVNIM
jgi:hypothetical protein